MIRSVIQQVLGGYSNERSQTPINLLPQDDPIDTRHLFFENQMERIETIGEILPRLQPAVMPVRNLNHGERPTPVPTLVARQRKHNEGGERSMGFCVAPVAPHIAFGVADVLLERSASLASIMQANAILQPAPRLGALLEQTRAVPRPDRGGRCADLIEVLA